MNAEEPTNLQAAAERLRQSKKRLEECYAKPMQADGPILTPNPYDPGDSDFGLPYSEISDRKLLSDAWLASHPADCAASIDAWQAIESAPKTDGITAIIHGTLLTYCCNSADRGKPMGETVAEGRQYLGRWWVGVYECIASHWQPLPQPPALNIPPSAGAKGE